MNSAATTPSTHWKPSASLASLQQAAKLRSGVRQWMASRDILEVWTPPLSVAANTDPQVESIVTAERGAASVARYLHTSPEFCMKRLLCANPQADIYQIATVFRSEEHGRFHASQFSMLEWYRVGMDHHALMDDTQSLLQHLWESFDLDFPTVHKRSYCHEVQLKLGCYPDELSGEVVRGYFDKHNRSFPQGLDSDLSACLDLFMDEFVVPDFDADGITFLYEYPASQAALARTTTTPNGVDVAERFEVFAGRVELANGFHELADAAVQSSRFKDDLQIRQARSQRSVPIDENLIAALTQGLPDCAGIALGLDRLHMILGEHTHIRSVLSFDDERA